MAQTVTLEISDNIYAALVEIASQVDKTPEQIILHWLENRLDSSTEDPLLALAGVFEAPVSDVSAKHDHYIGSTIQADYKSL